MTRVYLAALLIVTWLAALPAGAQSPPLVSGHSGRAGIGFYRTDSWAQVGVTLVNRRDEAADLLVVVALDETPNTQYASRVWLPARTSRRVIQPVRTSKKIELGRTAQPARTMIFENRDGKQTLLVNDITEIQISQDRPTTGVFADGSDEAPGAGLSAARRGAGWTPRLHFFNPTDTPRSASALGALDSLVIARERPDLDGAQMEALRQWLVRGGRLWVMLDRVSPEFMRQLLGEDWDVTVVDSVELSRVTIKGPRINWTRDFDQPVLFTRTISNEMEVLYSVDGWPAAYRKSIGQGTLMVTTLAGNGWIREDRSASKPLANLATIGLQGQQSQGMPTGAMTHAAMGQIGYRILGRAWVIVALGAYCVVLAAGGLWLLGRGRLDLLAPAGAGAALTATLFFAVIGSAQRQATPSTLASQQIVEVVPSQRRATVHTVLGIYSPGEKELALDGSGADAMLPDFSSDPGRVHRLEFLDLGRWRWEGVTAQSGGVRTGGLTAALGFGGEVVATVTLGETTLSGRIDASALGGLGGVALASGSGWMVPKVEADGSFSGTSSELPQRGRPLGPLPRDEFEARQRQVIAELLRMPGYPGRPVLVGWNQGLEDGLSIIQGLERKRGAVVVIPLKLTAPKPGERVTIPSLFIVPHPTGDAPSLLFEPMRRRWNAQRSDSPIEILGFKLPEEALPFEVERGRLLLDIQAPQRQVTIQMHSRGKPAVDLMTLHAPMGLVSVPIPPEAGLTADAEGVVAVRIKVGPASREDGGLPPAWTLEDAAMEVGGVVGTRR